MEKLRLHIPTREIAVLLTAGSIAAGCGGSNESKPDETPPPVHPVECKTTDLDCLADVTTYPALADYRVSRSENVDVEGHTISALYLKPNLQKKFSHVVKPISKLILEMSTMDEPFTFRYPNGNMTEYTTGESEIHKHRIIFGPANLPLKKSAPEGASSLAFTMIPLHTPKLSDETVSVVGEDPANSSSEYPGGESYIDTIRSLGTEVCQSLLAIEPETGRSEPTYYDERTLGQEIYCNSSSFALGAALNDIPFGMYSSSAPSGSIALGNERYPLIPVNQETYQLFEDSKSKLSER